MTTSAVLLSWPFVIVAAALMLLGSYIFAAWRLSRIDGTLTKVAAHIAERGILADPSTFTVSDPRHIVVITAGDVLVVDVERGQLAQHFKHGEIHGLRIAEGGQHIAFSFLLHGGAESRTILSRSIVEFDRLFQMIARQGKELQFIPEKAV